MKIKDIKIVSEDLSPESIKNITGIVIVDKHQGLGATKTISFSLEGTVKEKLMQYKEKTGNDWPGRSEQTYTTFEKHVSKSLNIGKEPLKLEVCENDKEAQGAIDDLVICAKVWLKEDKEIKNERVTKKEVEALSL